MREHIFNLGTRICLGGEGLGLYAGKAITMPISSLSTTISVHPNKGEGIRVVKIDDKERVEGLPRDT